MARRTVKAEESARRERGGGKLQRSETVTVRLDPRLRYLAEIGARLHRRTLSSFIEWAVEDGLKRIYLPERAGDQRSIEQMSESLWDTHEGERLCRLAISCPALLTYDEQSLWKFILESQILCDAKPGTTRNKWDWNWECLETDAFPRLRDRWNELKNAFHSDEEVRRKWIKESQSEWGIYGSN